MRRIASLAQLLYATILCAFLAAKLPSLVDADAPVYSIFGALFGATMALVAFGIGSLLWPLAENAEANGTPAQLTLMRGVVVCLAMAMTTFTAYLYLPYGWLKLLLAASIISGAICIFGANIVTWKKRGTDV